MVFVYIDENNVCLTEIEARLTKSIPYRCILMKIMHLSFK